MRALLVPVHGPADVLSWVDVPEPTAGPGQLLVRVRAVAVDWADILLREGRYPGALQPPFVSGHTMVGDVVARGEGVVDPPVGTRVFGAFPRRGVAAEYVAVPRDQAYVAPEALSDEATAGLAGQYFTADIALHDLGRLEPGEDLLVHAAGGSFGSACVQLARARGARRIIATAGSEAKLAVARACGADVLVNYREVDVADAVMAATDGAGVDVVAESVGGDILSRTFDCLRPLARVVSVGASSGRGSDRLRLHTLLSTSISVSGFSLGTLIASRPERVRAAADRVLAGVRRGEVRPVVARVFPVAQASDAHRFLESRQSAGRTVLTVAPVTPGAAPTEPLATSRSGG